MFSILNDRSTTSNWRCVNAFHPLLGAQLPHCHCITFSPRPIQLRKHLGRNPDGSAIRGGRSECRFLGAIYEFDMTREEMKFETDLPDGWVDDGNLSEADEKTVAEHTIIASTPEIHKHSKEAQMDSSPRLNKAMCTRAPTRSLVNGMSASSHTGPPQVRKPHSPA